MFILEYCILCAQASQYMDIQKEGSYNIFVAPDIKPINILVNGTLFIYSMQFYLSWCIY